MKNLMIRGAAAIDASMRVVSTSIASARVAFMDNIRYLMVLLVVVHHSVAAYAIVAPHWPIHDTNILAADIIRELFDVFMMPVLFFVAGYFALRSLDKKGPGEFLKDKLKRLFVPWALAVLLVLPLAIYDHQPVNPIRPFWKYWLSCLSSFEVRLRFTQAAVGSTTQAVYWFISLLFVFFLLVAYLVFGQPLFAHTAGTANLSVGYLVVYAFLRSFLLLSLLVILVSFGVRYWNYASGLDRQLAAASYNIYLVHFFIVVGLQTALLSWIGGPVPVKIAIIFLGALILSFALSRWVRRATRAYLQYRSWRFSCSASLPARERNP